MVSMLPAFWGQGCSELTGSLLRIAARYRNLCLVRAWLDDWQSRCASRLRGDEGKGASFLKG
jgi:hypothetical protein